MHAWYEDQLQEPEEAAAPNVGSAAKRQRAGTTAGGRGPQDQGARSGVRTRAVHIEPVPDSEPEGARGQDCGEGRADSSHSACSDGVPNTPMALCQEIYEGKDLVRCIELSVNTGEGNGPVVMSRTWTNHPVSGDAPAVGNVQCALSLKELLTCMHVVCR